MIFKLEFKEKKEFVQAKTIDILKEKYIEEYGIEDWKDVIQITEISDEEAKGIILTNTDVSTFDECPEFSLYDSVVGDDFCVVSSTDWD